VHPTQLSATSRRETKKRLPDVLVSIGLLPEGAYAPEVPGTKYSGDDVDASVEPCGGLRGTLAEELARDSEPVDGQAQYQPQVGVEGDAHHTLFVQRDLLLDVVVHQRVEFREVLL